ncbi:MAG: alpha/beta hydrolase [Aureispira sp.]|nr:alpha/beta hydrolase [Aureispira sp.]
MKSKNLFRKRQIVLLVLVGIFIYTGRLEFTNTEEEYQTYLEQQGCSDIHCGLVDTLGRSLHYTQVGQNEQLPLVIFVHGSPGSSFEYKHLLADTSINKHAQLIAVDRLGFGLSSEHGVAECSLEKQAAMLKKLLDQFHNPYKILVGHSWGGPTIARLTMDYPKSADALIFLAASLSPDLEPSVWYRYILNFPLVRWAIPRTVVASNSELFTAQTELKKMLPLWSKITIPCTVIQGQKDKLVPPANAIFAQKMLINAPTQIQIVDSLNHFIPWLGPDLVRTAILEKLKNAQ